VLTLDTTHFGDAERASWEATKAQILDELVAAFGSEHAERKQRDFMALGPSPLSVVAYHNEVFAQCRRAFIDGAYYPTLLGACGLGERILNHLVLDLRESFAGHIATRRIARKESFQNWARALEVLGAWDVMRPETAVRYRRLEAARNAAVHYEAVTDNTWRERALRAMTLLHQIIERQFGISHEMPWLFAADGAVFVRRSWEETPFVTRFYLPNCALVSSQHDLAWQQDHFVPVDQIVDCPDVEWSDEEFAGAYERRER
jgi:hypothetical protein